MNGTPNQSSTLRLYVDPTWRHGGIHTPLLNPWWGNPLTESSLFTKLAFDTFPFSTSSYEVVDTPRGADAVLAPYPHAWYMRHAPQEFTACVARANELTLPLIIDGSGDIERPLGLPCTIVLRFGGYRFLPEPGRVDLPLFADDLLARCRAGVLTVREKTRELPVVGFAGWASLTPQQRVKTFIKEVPNTIRALFDERYRACTKGVVWRMRALRVLAASPKVRLLHRARSSFSGSVKTAEASQEQLRAEMVQTIIDSDYGLDVRGDGNNTVRLAETLSLGRIPVILDTERNLPFSRRVDYRTFALVVDFKDIDRLADIVAAFHESCSPEQFVEMQRTARRVYDTYFRPDVMMNYVIEDIHAEVERIKANL